jgi:hypothetical protein
MYRLHHLKTSLGVALALVLLTSLLRAQSGSEIPSPATWVPFAADLVGQQDSTTRLTGRYFRSSEGSTRIGDFVSKTRPDDRDDLQPPEPDAVCEPVRYFYLEIKSSEPDHHEPAEDAFHLAGTDEARYEPRRFRSSPVAERHVVCGGTCAQLLPSPDQNKHWQDRELHQHCCRRAVTRSLPAAARSHDHPCRTSAPARKSSVTEWLFDGHRSERASPIQLQEAGFARAWRRG